MPSDPHSPKPSSSLYRDDAPGGGGGGGIFIVILLLIVLGGGAAYYFMLYKPGAGAGADSAGVMSTPTPAPGAPAPTPAPKPIPGNPTYSGAQRQQYIAQARDAFKALRQGKLQPFSDAYAEFTTAGSFTAATLPSRDAITVRRAMVKKCIAANDDYAAFVKVQEDAYKAELRKTPLVPNDVEVETSYAFANTPTDKVLQLRTLQGDSLKTADSVLGFLDSTFGAWSLNAEKHLIFKKSADMNSFSGMIKTYNGQVEALNKLRDEVNATQTDPTNATGSAVAPASSAVPSSATTVASPAASAAPHAP